MLVSPKYQFPIPEDGDNRDIPRDIGGVVDRLEAVLPTLVGESSTIVTGKSAATKVANGLYRVTHTMGRKPEHVLVGYGVGGTGDALSVRWVGFGDYGPTTATFHVVVRYTLSDALYTGASVNVGWLGW